jgi:hypothetical protein
MQKWRELLEACIAETNSEALLSLIYETEEAIVSRSKEIAGTRFGLSERQDLAKAAESLFILKTERLGWPGVGRTA